MAPFWSLRALFWHTVVVFWGTPALASTSSVLKQLVSPEHKQGCSAPGAELFGSWRRMAPNYGHSAPGAEWRRTIAPNYPGAELAPNSGAEWSWRRTIFPLRDLLVLWRSSLTSQSASHPVAEFGSWSRMAGAEWSRMEPNGFVSLGSSPPST